MAKKAITLPAGTMPSAFPPYFKKRTLQQIIREHLTFGAVSKNGKDRIRFFALALAGEAGELANNAKKEWRGDRKYKGKKGQALWLKLVEEETVDLGNYVFMMAEHLGIDLAARMERKLIEVEERDDDWNKVAPRKSSPYLSATSKEAKDEWLGAGYNISWLRLSKAKARYYIRGTKFNIKQRKILLRYYGNIF